MKNEKWKMEMEKRKGRSTHLSLFDTATGKGGSEMAVSSAATPNEHWQQWEVEEQGGGDKK